MIFLSSSAPPTSTLSSEREVPHAVALVRKISFVAIVLAPDYLLSIENFCPMGLFTSRRHVAAGSVLSYPAS